MAEIQSNPPRNWRGWYGYTRLDALEPWCVIDSLTYGVGEVSWRAPGGGVRKLGLRPLWPDAERERTYQDFYSKLQASVEKYGIKVPVLLYQINGKHYVRYGASRLWIAKKLGHSHILSIVCDMDCEERDPKSWVELSTPIKVLEAVGDIHSIGTFEVTHERIDLHNAVPWGEG